MATSKYEVSEKVVAHRDGTGSVLNAKDGKTLRRLSEDEMRVLFGSQVIDALKQGGPLPTGNLTVTEIDRERGVVTVSTKG